MPQLVTSLIAAAKNGEAPLVRKALDDGADHNGKDEEGSTALHHAVWQGYKDIVQILLDEKVDANAKDNTDKTPLSWAAAGGTDKTAGLLLAVDGIDPNCPDKDGKTPLAWAAQCGKDRVAKLLLAWKGIDVNATDKDGSTPLFWAACRGNTAVLKLLLACEGIKPNEKDKDGLTSLSWAALRGHDACVKRLLAWDGIDANIQDNEGSTPLIWAACRGQAGSVRLLLAHDGINPDLKDLNDRTPLSWAADRGHDDALKLLIAHKGVDIQSTDMDGSTPLLWAACHGHEKTVSLLIAKGADQDIEDKDDWTPLTWANHRGHEAVVRLLQSAAEGVETDSSETWLEVPSGGDQRNSRSLPVRLDLRSYLFDDSSTDFPQRTIDAADEWMRKYRELLENKIDPWITAEGAQEAKTTKVKVAVLDSGVDWVNDDIYLASKKKPRKILGYKNFVGDRNEIPENDKSCVDDDVGHGTHVTTLVLNTSLGTEVYVGRIAHEGKLADPKHVAEAIMWATNVWKVDIISMSMGFDQLDLTISNAIKHAYLEDVIMLAAAANHGGNAKIAFPADQYSMVLGVNSTDGYGNPSLFTPSPSPLRENYSILGEGVESGWPERLGGPTMRKGGTSFATPIAAGLAATLLYYAKVKLPKREGSRRFGSVGKIRAMLSAIGNDRQGYKYLAPFPFFETKSDRLVRETFGDIWENSN